MQNVEKTSKNLTDGLFGNVAELARQFGSNLAKVRVDGSNPFARSKFLSKIKLLWQGGFQETRLVGATDPPTGRAHDAFAASGDIGLLVSIELRLPTWNVIPADQLQLFSFLDYGSVHYHQTPIDPATLRNMRNGADLMSTGAGLHYLYDRYLDFRLDYGFQLAACRARPARQGAASSPTSP